MKRKMMAILLAFVLAAVLSACGGGETTLTGLVVSVDGTVVSVAEMDSSMEGMAFAEGQMPSMPSGMEGFEGFDPEKFEGTLPEGGDIPQWSEGEMPQMPEGMTIPEDGQLPDFGENGGMDFDFGGFASDLETTDVDIGDAHISVEIDGGKASGSMEDITPGTSVTITMNGRGKATNVLVSSGFAFGGGRNPMV